MHVYTTNVRDAASHLAPSPVDYASEVKADEIETEYLLDVGSDGKERARMRHGQTKGNHSPCYVQ